MRRNVKSASITGRPYSGGRHSGGANSIASQSVNSYRQRTPVAKKASGSCRSTICDQNSIGGSSYQRNNPPTSNNSNSPTRHRPNVRGLRVKSHPANGAPKVKRCCRRRKVNTLRQCAANRFGELSKNPFINFFRAYKRKHTDMSLIEIASRVAKIWNNMSDKQKVKYQLPPGYAPTGSGGGNKRGAAGAGGRRRSGRGLVASPRRPRKPYNIAKPPAKERVSPDHADDLHSDQTMPSSRSRSNSQTASLSD